LFGVATSAYQVEGEDGAKVLPYNQWQRCEQVELEVNGKKSIPVPYRSASACEHWIRYKKDIKLMKDLGFNSYRFSVSWGKVEPVEGEFNQEALSHYEDVCEELVKNGIKPIVTFHHYTHPCWFEDKGGFEKEENIEYFVRFCEQVFKRLNKTVYLWFTFNTFTGYAFGGYYEGIKPPFKKNMQLAVEVLKNLLDAHVCVYHKVKKINKNSRVGIYKNIFHIDPWRLWNPIDWLFSSMGNHLSNNCIYDFFNTGVFKVWVPKKAYMNFHNDFAIGAFDCVGLNYYSGVYVRNGKMIPRPECISTDNDRYTVYPEGFYRALKQVWDKLAKPIGVPVYVTENGVAPQLGCPNCREYFFKSHLHALSMAIDEGIDVRGYICWSLMDNFEWSFGYTKKYGICAVNFDTQERTLKEGTGFLIDVVNRVKV